MAIATLKTWDYLQFRRQSISSISEALYRTALFGDRALAIAASAEFPAWEMILTMRNG